MVEAANSNALTRLHADMVTLRAFDASLYAIYVPGQLVSTQP